MRRFNTYTFLMLLFVVLGCQKKDTTTGTNVIANDFLSDKKYDKLIVEIQYVKGFQPTPATVSNITTFLSNRLNKPGGITIIQTAISSPGKSSYTLDDVKNIESASRTQHNTSSTLTAYFIFVDADYASNSTNSKVLGMAYAYSSMVIFEKTIQDNSGRFSQPSVTTVESTVTLHEFGHLLGLVNGGSPMQTPHQDVANGKHCDDKSCLMYFEVESSDVLAHILGTNIPSLDANCLNDLRANGGK
jgi:predicted Zn-dependent protease